MKTASIQELHERTEEVLGWVAAGESVQILRDKRALAVLQPAHAEAGTVPDYEARMKRIFGDRVLDVSWADLISESRGRD
jgi:antitoxin (DNA-binding transcriptional repressor) of toxin-antitoxin stability system